MTTDEYFEQAEELVKSGFIQKAADLLETGRRACGYATERELDFMLKTGDFYLKHGYYYKAVESAERAEKIENHLYRGRSFKKLAVYRLYAASYEGRDCPLASAAYWYLAEKFCKNVEDKAVVDDVRDKLQNAISALMAHVDGILGNEYFVADESLYYKLSFILYHRGKLYFLRETDDQALLAKFRNYFIKAINLGIKIEELGDYGACLMPQIEDKRREVNENYRRYCELLPIYPIAAEKLLISAAETYVCYTSFEWEYGNSDITYSITEAGEYDSTVNLPYGWIC